MKRTLFNINKKLLPLILTICSVSNAMATAKNERIFPNGCRQVGFSFEANDIIFSKIADGQDETIYLVHNNSANEIILEAKRKSNYFPDFKKTIPANHWAAFSRLDNTLQFSCRLSDQYSDHRYQQNCQRIIQLCNYNNAKFPKQNLGTYWLQTTSPNQKNVMKFAIKKGILLRW